MTPRRISMKGFARKYKITINAQPIASVPSTHPNQGAWRVHNYKVTVTCQHDGKPRRMICYWSGASAVTKPPTAADIMNSLACDAGCVESARDLRDFAAETGDDPTSKDVRWGFAQCKQYAERLRNLLGDQAYERLLYYTDSL